MSKHTSTRKIVPVSPVSPQGSDTLRLNQARDTAELLVLAIEGLGARAAGTYDAFNGRRECGESICAEDFDTVIALAYRLQLDLIELT